MKMWLLLVGAVLILVGACGNRLGLPLGRHDVSVFTVGAVAIGLANLIPTRRDRDRSGDASGTPGDRSEEPGP